MRVHSCSTSYNLRFSLALLVFHLLVCHQQTFGMNGRHSLRSEEGSRDDQRSSAKETRSRYWKHISETHQGLMDSYDQEHFSTIEACMEKGLHALTSSAGDDEEDAHATVSRTIDIPAATQEERDQTILVEIEQALTPHQAQTLQVLADCTRTSFPQLEEVRSFGQGGNTVVFLNVLLQLFLPTVADRVYEMADLAYQTAHWSTWSHPYANVIPTFLNDTMYPPPSRCGLRTTEYLDYSQKAGHLHLDEHDDLGSLYTVLFALSDPETDYQGGSFYIRGGGGGDEDDDSDTVIHEVKPLQFSAVVFLSHHKHGVHPIEFLPNGSGRQMFTNELWMFPYDPPFTVLRPILENMEHFVEQTTSSTAASSSSSSTPPYSFPHPTETRVWLEEQQRELLADGKYNPVFYGLEEEDDEEEL